MAKQKLPVEKLTSRAKGKPAAPTPVTIVDVPRTSEGKDYEERERKYRAERALEDIERAEKHKRDKSLMKDVKACAADKLRTYKGL